MKKRIIHLLLTFFMTSIGSIFIMGGISYSPYASFLNIFSGIDWSFLFIFGALFIFIGFNFTLGLIESHYAENKGKKAIFKNDN